MTTVNGATLEVSVDGDKVSLTDGACTTIKATATDIEASNGVIHVIDGVLLPTS
ncbi:MAG: fasciclin domain-containing protein [Ornithinibacter sp.]